MTQRGMGVRIASSRDDQSVSVVGKNSSNSDRSKEDNTDRVYKALRYAVKFDPPCVFLEYEDSSAKRRVRAVGHLQAGTVELEAPLSRPPFTGENKQAFGCSRC